MFILNGRRSGGDLLAFGPDGQTLAARCETGLQIWRGLSGGARPKVLKGLKIGWLQFSPNGKRLYLDGAVSGVLDLRTNEFTPILQLEAGYRFLSLSPDGAQMLAAYFPDGHTPYRIESWSAEDPGKVLWSVTLQRSGFRPMFLSNTQFAILESAESHDARMRYRHVIRSTATGEQIDASRPVPWFPDWDAVSPDGKWIAGGREQRIAIWSVARLQRLPLEMRNDTRTSFTDIAFHPSGRYLAATNNDATVKLYDTTTWELARTFTWNIGKMRAIAFSPDGALAAAGNDTGKIVVWDVDQ